MWKQREMWEQRIYDIICKNSMINEDFVMAVAFDKKECDVLLLLFDVDITCLTFPKDDDDWSAPQLILKYENGEYRLTLETYQNGGYDVIYDNVTTLDDAAKLFIVLKKRFQIVDVNGNSIVDADGNLMNEESDDDDDGDYSDDDIRNTIRAADRVSEMMV